MSREWHLKRDRAFRKKLAQKLKSERAAMSIFKEPKIDCHAARVRSGQFSLRQGHRIQAVRPGDRHAAAASTRSCRPTACSHALLVQPNSGYGSDNSCMLDTIARGGGRFKGIAIIDFDADLAACAPCKREASSARRSIRPSTAPTTTRDPPALIGRLAELDMFLQIQSEHDQLSMFVPWIEAMPIRVLIDHCGRPTPEDGPASSPAFRRCCGSRARGG